VKLVEHEPPPDNVTLTGTVDPEFELELGTWKATDPAPLPSVVADLVCAPDGNWAVAENDVFGTLELIVTVTV
jgi:hypothetical protein